MGKRKRINVSVDEALYQKLTRIKEAYGFTNICELNVALLNIVAQYIDAAEQRSGRLRPPDADDIPEMFNDLGGWERTPDGVAPVRHAKKTVR